VLDQIFPMTLAAAAPEGGSPLLPPFLTPEAQVLLWSVVVFFLLLAILWKTAWGPIMHALEEREHKIQKTIDDAELKNKEAIAKVAEYEKKINTAKDEAAAIIAEGKRDVEKLKAEILAEANVEAGKTLERAKREIGLAKDAAVAELRDKMVGLTAQIATRVIEREVKADDHTRFISEALQKVEANKN
jgi:F-type H+-transporting ATPase subunit b